MIKHIKIQRLVLFLSIVASATFVCVNKFYTKSHLSVEQMDFLRSNYGNQVKAIDEASAQIKIANSFYDAGSFNKSAEAYKKAYDLDSGSRTFVGFKLISAYEKMGLYDKGLAVLNEMEKKSWSEFGHKKAADLRSHLLAAKANAERSQ